MKRLLAAAALLACATIASSVATIAWAQAPAPVIAQISFNTPAVPGTVIFINGSGFTGASAVNVGGATDGAFQVVSDTQINYTVPIDGPSGGTLTVVTPGGSVSYAAPVVVTAYTPIPPPPCLPNTGNLNTLFNPSTGNTIVSLWCDGSWGTYHYAVSGNTMNWTQAQCLKNAPPFVANLTWLGQAWNACVNQVMSPSDQAYANRLAAFWVPRPTVKGTGPQTIFTQASNGGLGSPLILGTPQAFQTIAGGTTTGGLRLPGGNVTRYCDVSGNTSIQGNVIPAKSYAACTLVFPPAGGFLYPPSADKASISAPTEVILVDAAHHLWGIDARGVITVDGIEDSTSAGVIELAYVSGLMWQENGSNLWWSKTAPSAAWLPPAGTATAPL
jgi:hypothetical protein